MFTNLLFGSNAVTLGKHAAGVDFTTSGAAVVTLGDFRRTVTSSTPTTVADAVRAVVGEKITADQAAVDRRRLIEDTRRALGN